MTLTIAADRICYDRLQRFCWSLATVEATQNAQLIAESFCTANGIRLLPRCPAHPILYDLRLAVYLRILDK